MNNKLPIQSGINLSSLAMKVADMQDAGVAKRKVRRHFEEFCARMKMQCAEYAPHVEKSDPEYMDTMCDAGFCGFTPAGKKCLDCVAFDFQFHPQARHMDDVVPPDVAARRLIQIQQ